MCASGVPTAEKPQARKFFFMSHSHNDHDGKDAWIRIYVDPHPHSMHTIPPSSAVTKEDGALRFPMVSAQREHRLVWSLWRRCTGARVTDKHTVVVQVLEYSVLYLNIWKVFQIHSSTAVFHLLPR